jgi:hypothetical protein
LPDSAARCSIFISPRAGTARAHVERGRGFVPLFGTFDEKNFWLYNGVVSGERTRLYVLDKPDGGNVVVAAWAPNVDLWAANEAEITSIVGGIQIDLGS